ncbi:hypothetical protein ASZ90_010615 [hydrocarbon metagenome]|uniref:Uncharacterized protein n=1 Tax=hydrocarbon metagenome TaxID=938273 RepID=A0A0W8FFM0_9ZZZZ
MELNFIQTIKYKYRDKELTVWNLWRNGSIATRYLTLLAFSSLLLLL